MQNNLKSKKQMAADTHKKLLAAYRTAYEATPGLELFDRLRRLLLWGMMAIVAAQRVLAFILTNGSNPLVLLFGLVMGMSVPGIFALAIYRGPWTYACFFYLLAAFPIYELVVTALPVLLSGVTYQPVFYMLVVAEAAYAAYLLGMGVWLTIPAKSRRWAQLLHTSYQDTMHQLGIKTGMK